MADQWNNPCDGGQSSPHNAEWIAIVSNVDVDWRDELRARNHLVLVLILILVLQGSPGALSQFCHLRSRAEHTMLSYR